MSDNTKAYARLLRHEHSTLHPGIPPERRLMVALMRDAMRSIDRNRDARDSRRKKLFDQDAEWVLSNDRSWVHAFARVCESLDLDATAVRRSLGLVTARTADLRAARARLDAAPLRESMPAC